MPETNAWELEEPVTLMCSEGDATLNTVVTDRGTFNVKLQGFELVSVVLAGASTMLVMKELKVYDADEAVAIN